MDVEVEIEGEVFRWNADKAVANFRKHGVSFEQATSAFFDPWFRMIDAGRNDEARDALIGADTLGRVVYVVHIDFRDDHIRIISARPATSQERKLYGDL